MVVDWWCWNQVDKLILKRNKLPLHSFFDWILNFKSQVINGLVCKSCFRAQLRMRSSKFKRYFREAKDHPRWLQEGEDWKLFKQRRGEHTKCSQRVIFCSPNIGCAPNKNVCDVNLPLIHPSLGIKVWEMIFLWALTDCLRGPDTFWYMNLNLWYYYVFAWLIIQQVQQLQCISDHSRHLLRS